MPKSPKSAALKLIEGRGNGRDSGGRVVTPAPPFRRLPPTPPTWLDQVAASEWARVVPELARLDLLKDGDAAALAAYCEAWSLFTAASAEVERHGLLVERSFANGSMRMVPNPAVAILFKASTSLRMWTDAFGMSPAAEARLGIRPPLSAPDEDDPFA